MDDIESEQTAPPPTKTNATPLPGEIGEEVPDFLLLEQIPVNYVQQIETDLLEPVVFNQGTATTDGFCRFTLQNKGFLHSHSKLFVALKATTNESNFPMPHVGIGQIVKKAVLKIGNKTINEIDSWRHLHSVKSAMIANEVQLERETYMTGRYVNHDFVYTDGSRFDSSGYGLSTNVEKFDATGFEVPSWLQTDASKPEEAPSLQIDLSDLFPFLKVHQLPLYMINEPINIELTFFPTTGERIQIESGKTASQPCEIVRDDLKFCADYIYYGATDEMARYADRNKEMNFSFVDYRLVEHSTTQTAVRQSVVRNLGMANRLVPRIISIVSDSSKGEASLLGDCNALSQLYDASGNPSTSTPLRYNVKYNDRFEYTTAVDSMSRLFSQFTHAEGVPFLTRQEFSGESKAGGLTTEEFQGYAQSTELDGQFGYLATRLTNGRVGQRGIDLHLTADLPADIDLMRSFCEYVRTATLRDGMFEIYNA